MVATLLKDRRAGVVRWYHDDIVPNTGTVPDPAARIMDTAALLWQPAGAGTREMITTCDVTTRRCLVCGSLSNISKIQKRMLEEFRMISEGI